MRYHVVPNLVGGWELTFNGTKIFRSRFKFPCISFGVMQLIQSDKLYIHRKDGTIKKILRRKGQ